jgi:hypothetical protein
VYVLRFREFLSVEFPFCVLLAGEECLIRQKRNGNSVGISGERICCFTPSRNLMIKMMKPEFFKCVKKLYYSQESEMGLLNKSWCQAAALGVTKFTAVIAMNSVTLCCAA